MELHSMDAWSSLWMNLLLLVWIVALAVIVLGFRAGGSRP